MPHRVFDPADSDPARAIPEEPTAPHRSPPSIEPGPRKTETLWVSLVFLCALHAVGAGALFVHGWLTPFSPIAVAIMTVGFFATTFGISAGYHRLFAHRSYRTGPILKAALLVLGASAFQNSARAWARNHRLHHLYTDTDSDPYNARRGFWYSHIAWVVERAPDVACDTRDLEEDPLVRLQERYYLPLGVFTAFIAPTLLGWALGDAWGGFFLGGVWRLLLSYHATFSINSVAHWLGQQPYSSKHTARDNWLTALVTMGEGYHNFHHTFPGDYRNGVRFFDFDPPKWVLHVCAKLGWIEEVRRTPGHVIALRRLKEARSQLERKRVAPQRKQHLLSQADASRQLLARWVTASKSSTPAASHGETRRAFWRALKRLEHELDAT